ncbi:hypothetical protein F5888DRAFT_1810655 [Russula emetica]|nr:hypothetical protein F5888DRAFT_1810655 [Russula emetica]
MLGPGSSSETGWVMSEYGANLAELIALLGPTSYPAASTISATAENVEVGPATTSMSNVAHGKRRRDAEESYGNEVLVVDAMPPHKRVRGGPCNGYPEAAWSEARTHRTPDTRVPTNNNYTSKEAGRGAEGLATPNVQGVYHRSLLGPSSQQGLVVTTAQGRQPLGVEEREEALHHMVSTEQQEEGHLFEIPSDFEGFDILLAATEADWTRRAVDEIKCRLCPNRRFRKWDNFKRHCRTTEAHPLAISFCGHCGDFFARSDSLGRHLKRPPTECLDVTPEKAEEKRRETERVHGNFMGRLGHSLTTGEEIGTPFAQIIKQMYPESSKKRTGSGWE